MTRLSELQFWWESEGACFITFLENMHVFLMAFLLFERLYTPVIRVKGRSLGVWLHWRLNLIIIETI
jgi:hypothetical protein